MNDGAVPQVIRCPAYGHWWVKFSVIYYWCRDCDAPTTTLALLIDAGELERARMVDI